MAHKLIDLGSREFIELSKDQYEEIKIAAEGLLEALYLEEKYDYLLINYIDFENTMLTRLVEHITRGRSNLDKIQSDRRIINVKIGNLLSTARLYIDHSKHHFSTIYGKKSNQYKEFETEFSNQYDSKLGYRVMEALRNYNQHRGFAFEEITYGTNIVDINDPASNTRTTITPNLIVSSLKRDKKFKKEILEELEGMNDTIDIKPLIREYVDGLSRVHHMARSILQEDLNGWESEIEKRINDFIEKFGEKAFFDALNLIPKGDFAARIYVSKRYIKELRKMQENKGVALINYFVSSEAKEDQVAPEATEVIIAEAEIE